MSGQYQYGVPQHYPIPSHAPHNSHGHHGRSRRGPRITSQNAHRQFKAQRNVKEIIPEPPAYSEYLQRMEAAKSFEFDDDELFCPFNLLTEDDVCLLSTFEYLAHWLTIVNSFNPFTLLPHRTVARSRLVRRTALPCSSRSSPLLLSFCQAPRIRSILRLLATSTA
jgi:hypothetical protein